MHPRTLALVIAATAFAAGCVSNEKKPEARSRNTSTGGRRTSSGRRAGSRQAGMPARSDRQEKIDQGNEQDKSREKG